MGGVTTGVIHPTQQMISAGLRTEKMGYPAKALTNNPRGISASKKSEWKKGFTTFQLPRSGTAGEMESKPMPVNITLKQDCDSLQSHWPTK